MTAEEFIIQITKPGSQLTIIGEIITEKVEINTDIIATKTITVENCTFENSVSLKGINISCGLKFSNCKFLSPFWISSCVFSNYFEFYREERFGLIFQSSNLSYVAIRDSKIDCGVKICAKSVINRGLLFEETAIGRFLLSDSVINTIFDIYKSSFGNEFVIIDNSTVSGYHRFRHLSATNILFGSATYKDDFYLYDLVCDNLYFQNAIFNEKVEIFAGDVKVLFLIEACKFEKSISVTLGKYIEMFDVGKGNIKEISLSSSKFSEPLVFNGNNSIIKNLALKSTKYSEGDIHFNSLNFESVKITGSNYNSNIVFNGTKFKRLVFDYFFNYSTLSLISTDSYDSNTELSVNHSNLGKAHLFNINLNSFDIVSINESVMTDLIVANIKWFDDHKLNVIESPQMKDYSTKREIYRQIKFALEKQGDRITSLEFKGRELNAFKKELFSNVNWNKKILSIDRFILFLSQSNDFGQNWLKPILLAIGVTLLFYFPIVVEVSDQLVFEPNFTFQSIYFTTNEFFDHIYAIPLLLNPTNSLSEVFPEINSYNFTVNILDYLLKIILAFLIFQTVSAFRKYIK